MVEYEDNRCQITESLNHNMVAFPEYIQYISCRILLSVSNSSLLPVSLEMLKYCPVLFLINRKLHQPYKFLLQHEMVVLAMKDLNLSYKHYHFYTA